MRIIQVSKSDFRGAFSRGVLSLHRQLLERGVTSRFFSMERCSEAGEQVIPAESVPIADFVQKVFLDEDPAHALASSFTLGWPSGGRVDNQALRDADIVHLHDIKGLLSPQAVNRLLRSGKPIVWSLSDMWAFTGGCHQALDCRGYEQGCRDCVQLLKNPCGLPPLLLEKKRALLSSPQLHILATSKWLAEGARASRVFGDASIHSVPPIANDAIHPQPRATAKARLGIDPEAFTLLLICENTGLEQRRCEAVKNLLEACSLYKAFRSLARKKKLCILILGSVPEDYKLDFGVIRAGSAGDPQKLSLLLSAADLAVLPQVEENGNQIILEAARCGTPVVAMNAAGMDEAIQDGVTGRLVPASDPRRMAEEISYLALHPDILGAWSRNCSNLFEQAPGEAVASYEALYRQLAAGAAQRNAPEHFVAPDLREEIADLSPVFFATLHFSLASVTDAAHAKADSALLEAERLKTTVKTAIGKLSLAYERMTKEVNKTPENPKLTRAVQSVGKLRNRLARILREIQPTEEPQKQQEQRKEIFRVPKPSRKKEAPVALKLRVQDRLLQWAYETLKKRNVNEIGSLAQYPPRPLVLETFPRPRLQPRKLPTIAMVTPSYMQGCFIEQTIRSVVDQNYPKLRYAVQDAASSDETVEILKKYSSRITTWISEPDTGQARAVASGFEKVSGDIMAWLNSDDLLMPGTLRFVGEYFKKHPDVDALYGHRVVVNEAGEDISRWTLPRHDPNVLRTVDYVPQETLFWRRSIWEKVGGIDPKFLFALDWDLLLRFQNAGAKIVRVPYYLGCFRAHTLQKTSAQMETTGNNEINYLRSTTEGAATEPLEMWKIGRKVFCQAAFYRWLLKRGVRW